MDCGLLERKVDCELKYRTDKDVFVALSIRFCFLLRFRWRRNRKYNGTKHDRKTTADIIPAISGVMSAESEEKGGGVHI